MARNVTYCSLLASLQDEEKEGVAKKQGGMGQNLEVARRWSGENGLKYGNDEIARTNNVLEIRLLR